MTTIGSKPATSGSSKSSWNSPTLISNICRSIKVPEENFARHNWISMPQATSNNIPLPITATLYSTTSPYEALRRKKAKDLLDQVVTIMGPPITKFLSDHGDACSPGSEASFTIQALNYVRSQWSTGVHGPLPLAGVMCVWSMKGNGLFHFFKDKLGLRENLVYRCTLCHEQKPGVICSVLEHIGMMHASPAERGMAWDLQSWPAVLPMRGVCVQLEMGRVVGNSDDMWLKRERRNSGRDVPTLQEDKLDSEGESEKELEIKSEEPQSWEAAVDKKGLESGDSSTQKYGFDQDVYNLFADAW